MAQARRSDPAGEVRRLYGEAESATAEAFERAVSRPSFGVLLAWMTENVVAVTKISTDVFDLVLRNLRVAGRQDITRLARQLNRTEDKLELVLQEVERLRDELASDGAKGPRRNGRAQDSARKTTRGGTGG